MSNLVFPVLRGLGWSVFRRPTFEGVTVKRSRNAKRTSVIYQTSPVWDYELTYPDYLNDVAPNGANPYTDKKTIEGFYLLAGGPWDTWLFQDPEDNTYTAQTMIGTADGVNKVFQVARLWGGFNEPIQNINAGTLVVKDNGVTKTLTTDYTVSSTGVVTFVVAPIAGHAITADFAFKFRCEFMDNNLNMEEFMYQLWTLDSVKFRTIIL
jgi:uncharacterized protein (TIGR02217 family)